MRQFNKIVKLTLFQTFLMRLYLEYCILLNYEDFKVRRGYAFIDIISDYKKKYPTFMNDNVLIFEYL